MAIQSRENSRFTDLKDEPVDRLLSPIRGYEDKQLVPLTKAIKPISNLFNDIEDYAYVALHNCQNPADELNQQESASIHLYTMQFHGGPSLYLLLNQSLREENREGLIVWFSFLKLFLTALYKLPSHSTIIWRGIKNVNLSSKYKKGKQFAWWGVSSCTTDIEVLQSDQFLGKHGLRTLFSIECINGKSVKNHSYFKNTEKEIILMPGAYFEVVGQLNPSPDLHIIQLKEIPPPVKLIKPPFSITTSINPTSVVDKSNIHSQSTSNMNKQHPSSNVISKGTSLKLDEKPSPQSPPVNKGASTAVKATPTTKYRPFKDKHHPLLIAIWDVDRTQTNLDKKLKGLRDLIKKGTNPSVSCEILHEQTGTPIAQVPPLVIACFEGDIDIIRFLIQNGADPNQTESEHHLTPIHVLCDDEYQGQSLRQKDRADLIRLFVKHGAQVNHLDRSSMAPIHKAVIHDRPECVEVLIESRVDPNVVFMGDTPLSIAARHNRRRIVQILLSYNETNVNHRNDEGGTTLHFAAAGIVDNPECVELLLQHGAKVNAQDLKKNTAAMVACFFDKPRILTTLIRAGADLVHRNNEGKDAYDVAVEKEFDKCKEIVAGALKKTRY